MRATEGDAFQPLPVRIHHIDMAFAIDGRTERDMPAVGRPGRRVIDSGPRRDLNPLLPVG